MRQLTADEQMPKFTTISPTSVPGKKQRAWERFRDGHYIAIGWLNHTDLTGKSLAKILDLIRRSGCEPYDERDGLRSFPRFFKLEDGDFVAVKNTNDGLFGIGIIRSGYKFCLRKHNAGRKDFFYPHYRDVGWIKTAYIPRTSLVFDGEKSWEPFGTVGQVYPDLPSYIVRILGESVPPDGTQKSNVRPDGETGGLTGRHGGGAGFGDPIENKQVEDDAIGAVRRDYESRGWDVRSVERDKCGFDLDCRKKGTIKNVEVKGVRGTEQNFVITAREVEQARTNPRFLLVAVTSALSASRILTPYTGHEFCQRFKLSCLQYRAVLQP